MSDIKGGDIEYINIKPYKINEIKAHDNEGYHKKGVAHSNRNEYDKAIKCFDKAIEKDPTNGSIWFNKGNALNALKKYDQAIKCYDTIIDKDPKYAYAWYNKGSVWFNKGVSLSNLNKYDEAIKYFDKAIQIYPENPDAIKRKKMCLSTINKYKKFNEFDLNNNEEYYKKGISFGHYVYVILTMDSKYYIGYTSNLDRRIYQHSSGRGGALCLKGHQISRVSKIKVNSEEEGKNEETRLYYEYRDRFGARNVRGAGNTNSFYDK